jgi:regulator of PEP synthase PpsR (kinase-PPPase family)
MNKRKVKKASPPVIIISGGSGASGQQIVETALAQFPMIHVPVIKVNDVRSLKQVEKAVKKAATAGGTVVHTLVERALRDALIRLGKMHNVVTIDLMGPLLEQVAGHYDIKPLEQPGLYRKLRKDYFDRVEAIDFAVAHDDGKKPEDLASADIVIIGVSRCGKTPLSMYLAVYGWKVANVPIVKDIPLPEELYKIDRRRVMALTIDQEHLLEHRKRRKVRMGTIGTTDYTKPSAIFEELEAARRIYREGGFHMVTVTDKSIEIIADEIITFLTRSRKEGRRKTVPL